VSAATKLITIAEAAPMLGVSESRVRAMLASGRLNHRKVDGRVMIGRASLMSYEKRTGRLLDKPKRAATLTADQEAQCKPFRGPVLYFIQGVDGGPIKIGITKSLRSRMIGLQGSCPVVLRVLAAVRRGGWRHEDAAHRRFKEHRLHGEWFAPHAELLAHIEMVGGLR